MQEGQDSGLALFRRVELCLSRAALVLFTVFDAMRGVVGMKEGNFAPALASIFTLHSEQSVALVCGSAEGLVWPL